MPHVSELMPMPPMVAAEISIAVNVGGNTHSLEAQDLNDTEMNCLLNHNTQNNGFNMQIAAQLIQFIIFLLVLLFNFNKLNAIRDHNVQIFKFICANMATMFWQIVLYSVMFYKQMPARLKFSTHLLLQIIVLSLLTLCFLLVI